MNEVMETAKKVSVMSKIFSKPLFFLRKHSPELLLAGGVIAIGAGVVLACKATLKVDEVQNAAEEKFKRINDAKDNVPDDVYSEEDYNKDLTVAYVQTAWDYICLYGPPITLTLMGIGLIITSHGIMKKRNIALMAAYKVLENGFNEYRDRVVEELGEEKEYMIRHNLKEDGIIDEVDPDTGEVKTVKNIVPVNPDRPSVHAQFFMEGNVNWQKNAFHNKYFLMMTQNYLNDRLNSEGHVFLNEVYDELGMDRTPAGQIVGWLKGDGTNRIDFGLFEEGDGLHARQARAFINGWERCVLVDFNVDGPIYDKI